MELDLLLQQYKDSAMAQGWSLPGMSPGAAPSVSEPASQQYGTGSSAMSNSAMLQMASVMGASGAQGQMMPSVGPESSGLSNSVMVQLASAMGYMPAAQGAQADQSKAAYSATPEIDKFLSKWQEGDWLYPGERPQTDVTYQNQLDNDPILNMHNESKAGSTQCTPTSTAMMILSKMSVKEMHDKTVEILRTEGHAPLPSNLDLPGEWVAWVLRERNQEFGHYDPNAQLVEDYTSCSTSTSLGDPVQNIKSIKEFPAVAITDLTYVKGHSITILEVRGDGIVVNDPYGAKTTGMGSDSNHYVKNGSIHDPESYPGNTGTMPPVERWQLRPDLTKAFENHESRSDWGEYNFFTWDEVRLYKIGAVTAKFD